MTQSAGQMILKIGDAAIEIVAASEDLPLAVEGPSQAFLEAAGDKGPTDIRLRARWADLDGYRAEGPAVFDPGHLWTLYRKNGHYTFQFISPVTGRVPYKVGRFAADFASGEVLLHRPCYPSGKGVYPLDYPLDELLLSNWLALGRGVILHACGLADSAGRGLLFVGCSGAGKTTTARLWLGRPGVRVFSDDRIVVRKKEDGRFWMFGTPWHGAAEIALAGGAALTRIFLLARGATNELVPLAAPDAVRRLFVASFPPFYSAGALGFTLDFFEELVQAAPCEEYRFVPDAEAVEFVERT
ncbi:MAG: hypothetical protein N3D11_03475 [Candidatus Sumerlaeia bacterium]|nr:hypothetical protein [Candidatus Sumerlaeia bacterium]